MTNNKQQTAVEWLEQEMLKPNLSMKEILKQAKEMEKEQIEQAELDAKEIIIIKHTEHRGGEQ
jgi:20S proteasome alpha/beta subunit